MTCEIPLTRGLVALVDASDFNEISRHRWYALSSGRPGGRPRFIAARTVATDDGRKPVLMHRVVIGAPAGVEVDHINRDPLDNRRANLRLATRSQNCANMASSNKTGFRGVAAHGKRFQAICSYQGRAYHVGIFDTAREAARAYDKFATDHHGPFAVLNFEHPTQSKAEAA